MNGIVIRLAGVKLPETKVFQQEVITIGTAPDCDVSFDAGSHGIPPEVIILTLRLREGVYRISTLDAMAGVTRDGEAIAVGDPIQDGDTFYFSATGIRIRFFALTDVRNITDSLMLGNAVLASTRRAEAAAAEAPAAETPAGTERRRRSVPRTDVAIVFVKQLLRELVAEIPRRVLYAIIGVASFILLLILGLNALALFYGHYNNKEFSGVKQTVGDLRQDFDKLREDLRRARQESELIRGSLSLPEKVVNSYGSGVCLIYGTYTFIDPRAGGEVRFKEPSVMENPIGQDGSVNLSVDGNGRVYEVEFIGTGFVVGKGLILTNRHVVQAWEEDDLASMIRLRGFRPKVKELLAYFPLVRQPFTLHALEVMQDQDVAICSFDQGAVNLPILPLNETGESIASGQLVVLIGYPAGFEGLVARVDEKGRAGSRRYGNLSYRIQLNELAANDKIRPQSTQGHISELSPQLVYDARTDEGGSGGPVFGANGKVIGINQAILDNPQATTNFGVLIRYGIELLNKHYRLNGQGTQSKLTTKGY